MQVTKPATMATKDIIGCSMHVEHGQKLVDVSKELLMYERTNGSEQEGEENSEPLAQTNFGLLKKSEQLDYKKIKAMVEDDKDFNGNFNSLFQRGKILVP